MGKEARFNAGNRTGTNRRTKVFSETAVFQSAYLCFSGSHDGRTHDVIYDVGLFDGEDTAYHLFRGYNVIAVDANPLMIERARLRFAKESLAKRLTLLNLGISKTPGEAVFWISDVPEWSSIDRSIASMNGTLHRSAVVPTAPFTEVLARHGDRII